MPPVPASRPGAAGAEGPVPLGDFLAELADRRVRLRVDGDRLRCTAPDGVLTPTVVAGIQARKAEILRHLREHRAIGPADRSAPIPLSRAQERLWLLAHLDPGDSTYHIPLAARLTGPLRPAGLAQALTEVTRRHEVLRTCYPARHGRPYQRVTDPAPVPLPVVDLSGLPAAVRERTARGLAVAEARLPFDLGTGPVWRTWLLRHGPAEHLLLVTRHHIASDGWSFGVLAGELSALYRAFGDGRPSPLPSLPCQYADFATWQRRAAEGEAAQQRLRRWQRRLDGAPTTLSLIPDRANPHDGSGHLPVQALGRELSATVTAALHQAARDAGTTVFTVLLTAFGLALCSAAGQDEVVVGAPVAGRVRPELEPLIGCFSTMLPLRLDLAGDPTFGSAVERVHATVTDALGDQDVPLEQLHDTVRLDRRSALFPAVLAFQNTPVPPADLPGVTVTIQDAVPVAPKFPLTVTLTGHRDGYTVLAEYDPTALHPDTAAEVADRFTALVGLGCQYPTAGCAELAGRAAGTYRPAPRTPAEPAPEQTLAELFTSVARRTPDAVALRCGRTHVSYAELYRRAGRLAARLRAAGVGPETLAGLCVEHSVELVVAVLAVALAGGGYVPVDPEDPPVRHEAVIVDAGVRAVVTVARHAEEFAWYDGPVVLVDRDRPGPPDRPDRPDRPGAVVPAAPDNIAYVIYTSGSSGTPKGVMVSHRCVTAMFRAASGQFRFGPGDVWSLTHSSAFDFSVWEMWGALLHGGCLVVVPRDTVRDPVALWRTVQDEQVTVFSATPGAFALLLPALVADGAAALRTVVLGGERCEPATLRAWFDALGDGPPAPHLVNMYGITETTVHVTHRRLARSDTTAPGSPIGRPLPEMHVHVVDRHGTPTATGGEGEMLVGGVGVARGYLGRPALTADRFRPDHLGGQPGARLYASGDLATALPGGQLGYLGRGDQQVTLRGYRIEPGEVEAVLTGHPDVSAVAVTARREGGRAVLAAYLVPAARAGGRDRAALVAGLRRHLAERLPAYMVPQEYALVDRLPLTRNGKLDYQALAAVPGRATAPAAPQPPRTPTERALAELWCELLGVDTLGVHDNFFELGGDSLLVTRLHARLPAAFGVDLPMRRVYQALDIASLAEAVDRSRPEGRGDRHHAAPGAEGGSGGRR